MKRISIYIIILIGFSINLYSLNLIDSLEKSIKTRLSKNQKDTETILLINHLLSDLRHKDPVKATEYGRIGIQIAELITPNKETANTYKLMAHIYLDQGLYDMALDYYFISLDIYQDLGEIQFTANRLYDISYAYLLLKVPQLAIQYSLKSIELAKQNLKKRIIEKEFLALSYNNLGMIYRSIGNIDSSLFYHNKAIFYSIKNNDTFNLAHAESYIGLIYQEKKAYSTSKYYFLKALKKFQSVKNLNMQGFMLNYLAEIKKSNGELDSSLLYFFEALKCFQNTFYLKQVANTYLKISDIYLKKNAIDLAIDFALKSIAVAKPNHYYLEILQAYQSLSQLYEKKNDFEKAFYWSKEVINTSKEMNYDELAKNIYNLEVQKSIEKKELELKLYKKETHYFKIVIVSSLGFLLIIVILFWFRFRLKEKANSQLIQKNEEITAQKEQYENLSKELNDTNAMKDKFFSIIAHDLKNPIFALKQATEILTDEYFYLNEEEKIEFIQNMKLSSNNVYELLENLLTWSRSQRGIINFNPVETNISFLISNTISVLKLHSDKKEINLISYVNEDILVSIDVQMISTVLRNLLSNAIKFTPEKGEIIIDSKILENHNEKKLLELAIKDNGIGIKEDDFCKLFRIDVHHTTIGTSKEKGTGLGLILCKEFIEKHNGTIRVESKINQGTSFFFTIPLN